MTARILPEPDIYAVCPDNGHVLSFYRDVFASAYVLLHPFIRPVGMSVDDFLDCPSLERSQICTACVPVTWSELQRLGGFSSLAEIDVALRTRIGGLKRNLQSQGLAAQLEDCLSREGLVQPTEGRFSDLTHNMVLSFLQEEGQSWVWVGDEFGTQRKLYWIDDLKKPDSDVTEGCCSVFTPDKSTLWTTHWDSHFAFVCGSNHMVDRLANDARFEGFRCDPGTEVYWSLQSC